MTPALEALIRKKAEAYTFCSDNIILNSRPTRQETYLTAIKECEEEIRLDERAKEYRALTDCMWLGFSGRGFMKNLAEREEARLREILGPPETWVDYTNAP